MLADAAWDGNVRQLRNVIERACILADGDFVREAISPAACTSSGIGTVSAASYGPLPRR